MSYKIYITPTAISDTEYGKDYYNQKNQGLGLRFVKDLDNNIKIVSRLPTAFSRKYKDVRGKLLKKFPYVILYSVDEERKAIHILRIFNTYMNPFWD